jgi:rubrerythrin
MALSDSSLEIPERAQAERDLIGVLQLAYSGELAAALAYRGHWNSTPNPEERDRIRAIELEELHHRAQIAVMLETLGQRPQRLREVRAWLIGRGLGLLCHLSGWLIPMYGAGKLESRNVKEYEAAARYARSCGRDEWVDCLLTMAEVEWEHEAFFRANVLAHPLGRRLPIWPAPAPKEHIRASFPGSVMVGQQRVGYSPLMAYWAFAFKSDVPLEAMETAWNEVGPWQWELRDSSWYGDYLNSRPLEGVRVRIHEFPQQASEVGVFVGPGEVDGIDFDRGYSALMEIESESAVSQADVDTVVTRLLSIANARDVRPIEPYD